MKKLILTLVSIFTFASLFAQAPEKMNYQAVARDLSGSPLANTTVVLQFEILESSASGLVVYRETQSKTTNQFGLFTAEIGSVTPSFGTFSGIGWGTNAYYLRISVDGDVMPATQLLSVPYALYSKTSGGAGAGLIAGNGVDITGGVITSTLDTSEINELQVLSVSNDTIFLSDGGFVQLPAAVGDNWGTDTVSYQATNITGQGTVVNPLIVIDNDTSLTNELQVISISNDTIFLSDGGFVQLPAAVGDNWGTDTVSYQATNITGQGTLGNPLIVIDNDTSATNEIQNLSWNTADGNTIDLTNGTGIQLASNTPAASQVLTWNGTSWIAQALTSGAWTKSGTNVYPTTLTDSVGIGTTTPQQLLTLSTPGSTTLRMERSTAAAFDWEMNVDNFGFHLKGGADGTAGALTDFVNVDGNGRMGLGTTTPAQKLDVIGITKTDSLIVTTNGGTLGDVLTNDGTGNAIWQTASGGGAFSTTSNVTSNAPGDVVTDDFVFGSPQLDYTGTVNEGYRVLFDKSNGAFRAGAAFTTAWDVANRGSFSTAFGRLTMASGQYSFAEGNLATATADGAISMGVSTTASGFNSVALGNNSTASGDNSVAIGSEVNSYSFQETVFGYNSTIYAPGSTNSQVGTDRLFVIGNGATVAARSNALTILKNGNVGVGLTPVYKLDVDGDVNTNTLYRIDGVTFLDNRSTSTLLGATGNTTLTGDSNTFVGQNAGQSSTTASQNIFLGSFSGNANTTGGQNVAIGSNSSVLNSLGWANVAVGFNALNQNATSGNTAVGYRAMQDNTTGVQNTSLGLLSLSTNSTGDNNTAIGNAALEVTLGSNNTGLGYIAGNINTTGTDNTFIGYNANTGTGLTNLTNATAIGSNATVGASNSLILGNNANVGIGTITPTTNLDVIGITKTDSLIVTTNSGVFGDVLTNDGTGNAIWQTAGAGLSGIYAGSNTLSGATVVTQLANSLSFTPTTVNGLNIDGNTFSVDALNNRVGFGITAPSATIHVSNNTDLHSMEVYNTTNAASNTHLIFGNNAATGTGAKFGLQITTNGSGGNNNYGGWFTAMNAATNTAINGVATASGSSLARGIFATASGTGTGETTAMYGQNSSQTTGDAYAGRFRNLNNSAATVYGVRSEIVSTSTNDQYGFRADVNGAGSAGTRYGIYTSVVNGTTNWAAYFAAGHVYIGDTLVIPTNAAAGAVLTSIDAAGTAVWQIPVGGGSFWNGSAGYTELATPSDNVGVGLIPSYKLDVAGDVNTNTLYRIDGVTFLDNKNSSTFLGATGNTNPVGVGNTAVGMNAGQNLVTGVANTFVGDASGQLNITGGQNVAVGSNSLAVNQLGWANVAIGRNALSNNFTSGNTAVGFEAMQQNTTGVQNVGLGYRALQNMVTGNSATAVGYLALENTTGDNNTGLGYGAGSINTTGTNNTFLGHAADAGSANLTNATAIGSNAIVNTSNSLILGNNANVGIGTSSPTRKLHVNDNSANPAAYFQQTGSGSALTVYSNTSLGTRTVFYAGSLGGGVAGFNVKGDGSVGIGTSGPNTQLDVAEDVAFRESVVAISINAISNMTGLADKSFVNFNSAPSNFTIYGIADGVDGKILRLYNSTNFNMTLDNETTFNTAANRILTMSGGSVSTIGSGVITLQYSANEQRWIVVSIVQ